MARLDPNVIEAQRAAAAQKGSHKLPVSTNTAVKRIRSVEVISALRSTSAYTLISVFEFNAAERNISGAKEVGYGKATGAFKLPFPENVEASASFDWSEEANGIIADAAMNAVRGKGEDGSDGAKLAKNSAPSDTNLKDALFQGGAGVAKAIADKALGSLKDNIARSYGVAVNPYEELAFKKANRRTLNLSFDIAPVSQAEAKATVDIINNINKVCYPKLTGGNLFFVYPNIVQVKVISNKNVVLFRGPCAITNLSANMTPEQFWTTFRDGIPVHMKFSLSVTDLTAYTQDTIRPLVMG